MDNQNDSNAVCYWGLDSAFWIHRKVFIKMIFDLQQSKSYKGFYECHGRVVSKVEIHGIIASVDEREKLVTYKVDDGTGIIACCCWRDTIKDSYTLGHLVTVQGKITEYRNEKQLTVNLISLEANFNSESLFWLDVVNLSKTLYKAPFSPPDNLLNCQTTATITIKCLLDVIHQWILDNKSCFSFAELCSAPEVLRLKSSAVGSDVKKDNSDQQSSVDDKYLRDMLCQLEKEGEVYYKDSNKDNYEIITHDKHLKPIIVKAIKDICKGSLHDGAHVSRITDVVHSSQYFGRVPCARIIESLKKLVENSVVYQKNDQVYCLV